MNLEEAIQLEKQLHPFSTRQDLYKLIVQSCLGNGHSITSPEDSFLALQEEKRIAKKDSLQEIGNGFIRVPLSYMKEDLYSLIGLERVVRGFYNDGTLSRPFYERLLYSFFDELPQKVNGLLIAFEPNIIGNDSDYTNSEKYGPANGRFTYYLSKNNNSKIQASYFDTRIFQNEAYTKTLSTGEIYISDIYKSPVNDKDLELGKAICSTYGEEVSGSGAGWGSYYYRLN